MTHLHAEARIERPVEHVWQLFCDVSRWQEWMPWGELANFSGPVDEVGTTYVHSVRLMGFEQSWAVTVVEVEPQRLYHEHSDTGPMDQFGRFERVRSGSPRTSAGSAGVRVLRPGLTIVTRA